LISKLKVDLFKEAVIENQIDLKNIPELTKYENVKDGPFTELTDGGIWHAPSIYLDKKARKRLEDADPSIRRYCIRLLYKQAAESCIESFEKMIEASQKKIDDV